jgi:surface carbohydrate biosynthesis protein
VKVGLIVDSPKRDLAGIVLTANELLKLGATPYVIPMYQQGYDVPLIAPDAIVVNYARPNNRELLRGYRELGIEVIVMDTEGGVLSETGSDSPENWAGLFKQNELDRCVDRYFFWGSRVRDAFAASGALPPDRLEVTGCPRYDFCHPHWSVLLDYPAREFVLVNTNFPAINPRFTTSAEVEIEIFAAAGWPRDYTLRLFEELHAVFPRYLAVISGMAQRNSHRKIIVRPHPFEDPALYTRRFEGHANILVDPSGSALNVIQASDCVVHLNCGTAVETLLLGKTPIALEYLNSERMRSHAGLPSAISCAAADDEDLDRLLNSAAERARRWQPELLLERHIVPWFHRIDGSAACRVAAAVMRPKSTRGIGSERSVSKSLAGGVRRPSLAQRAQGVASNVIGSRATARLRAALAPARREKEFGQSEVQALIDKIRACDGEAVAACVAPARHPLTGLPLASLAIGARNDA